MAVDSPDNVDDSALPFADLELTPDPLEKSNTGRKVFDEEVSHRKQRRTNQQSKSQSTEEKVRFDGALSKCYFENAENENSYLALVPYTGPCNTTHLHRQLYLTQIESKKHNLSSYYIDTFLQHYNDVFQSMKSMPNDVTIRAFLRVGILYTNKADSLHDPSLRIKDFLYYRKGGKHIKTAFYTCKGVTSPKRLITTLNKLNYRQISSNNYSYDLQLYLNKNRSDLILHFQFDEQFQCHSIYYHPSFPSNFDFIRDKSSSAFRSIDDSYADMFDFRVQVTYTKYLTTTDSLVTSALRHVPIDQILFPDKNSQILRIAPQLRRFAKYLKCNRSTQYQNDQEQVLINIGSYEEYQWDHEGICRPSMKAENTMSIELLEPDKSSLGKKLFDIGIWFSNLCQSAVDLSITSTMNRNVKMPCRWFCDVFVFARKYNKTTKQMNVKQLTTYKAVDKDQTYTSEDVSWVKGILKEENLKNLFLDANGNVLQDRKQMHETFEAIQKRLEKSPANLARKAMKRVLRAYRRLCDELDGTHPNSVSLSELK